MRPIVKMLVKSFRIHDPMQMIPFEEESHPQMVNRRGTMRRQQCFNYRGR